MAGKEAAYPNALSQRPLAGPVIRWLSEEGSASTPVPQDVGGPVVPNLRLYAHPRLEDEIKPQQANEHPRATAEELAAMLPRTASQQTLDHSRGTAGNGNGNGVPHAKKEDVC